MECFFDNDRPIYLQLIEMLRLEIISGRLGLGEKLPSVRELAITAKMNPNTVQKALAELERENIIYTERTNGKYVTCDGKLIEKMKQEVASKKIETFLNDMKNIGIDKEELQEYIKEYNKGE